MPTPVLTTTAQVTCPHSGVVLIVSKNGRVTSAGQPLASAGDQYQVVGCKNPPTAGPMCAAVMWPMPALRVWIGGVPALLATSPGQCLPVPVPPIVTPTPSRVQGT